MARIVKLVVNFMIVPLGYVFSYSVVVPLVVTTQADHYYVLKIQHLVVGSGGFASSVGGVAQQNEEVLLVNMRGDAGDLAKALETTM
jgi:hypothetical protein